MWSMLVLMGGVSALWAQSGDAYRVLGNSILVDRPAHWENWVYQNDLVSALSVPLRNADLFQIDSQGLRPVFFRRKINVAPNAGQFTYTDLVRAAGASTQGGAAAKSNPGLAGRLIDDDLSTYWEPSAPASYEGRLQEGGDFTVEGLRKWEVEIDLGRLVYADSITVVFPAGQFGEQFLGEPVKSFALFASMGERFPFPLGNNLKFSIVGQLATGFAAGKVVGTAQCVRDESAGYAGGTQCADVSGGGSGGQLVYTPGTEDRYVQVTFPLSPLDRADWDLDGIPDISGAFIQYVRLKITDSDLWRDAFLGAGEEGRLAYQALPPERQGAKVYQRQTAGGLLVELQDDAGGLSAREKYEVLSQEKRGSILYFAREVPRISEIQVWAKGDNYSLQPERRAGGSYENGGLGAPELATDGLYDTEWQANTWSPIYEKGTAWWDLGAVFWVDDMYVVTKRVQAYSNLEGAFAGPNILVSDGTLLNPLRMQQLSDFPQLEESLKWDNIIPAQHVDNRTPRVRIFHESLGRRKVRFLQVRDIDVSGQWSGRYGFLATPAEIHLYGEGYPVSVWAYSPPIALKDGQGNFLRKTLPRIAWQGEALVRRPDPLSGQLIEQAEPLEDHPQVRLQLQTRTSDQIDTNYTYFEVVEIEGAQERSEIPRQAYEALVLEWRAWEYWQSLPSSRQHESRKDDDGDGQEDEDPIDFVDNDGDGKIDEDGPKLRRPPRTSPERSGVLTPGGWSEWSASYEPSAGRYEATITSPNPRKFVQVRLNIRSEDPVKTGRVGALRIELAPPLSLEVAGELALLTPVGLERPMGGVEVGGEDYGPPREIDPLSQQRFSYFVRAAGPDPLDSSVRQGFDEVLLVVPGGARLAGVRLGQVRVGQTPSRLDPTQVQTTAQATVFGQSFVADGEGVWRTGSGQVLQVLSAGRDSVWVRFPFSVNGGLALGMHALVEVQFWAQSFREGVEWRGFIRASGGEAGLFQRVDAEGKDATELVDSGTGRVSLQRLGGGLIRQVSLSGVLTPNGDGINDEVVVRFALVKVLEDRPLEVGVYDLGGRLVGRGRSGGVMGKVGEQEFVWDGRDLGGGVVAPGLYVCRVRVKADQGDDQVLRLIHVAY
jgi:hypothetical protein